MIPAGYMAKKVGKPPEGLGLPNVSDLYSVSGCISENFADYIHYWKHNGYWLYNSPGIIQAIARENSIDLGGTSLFFYEVYEKQFDETGWCEFSPEASLPTNVIASSAKKLEGFDVVTFYAGASPECSPLSCNGLARGVPTNAHCLLESLEGAMTHLAGGSFKESEPGPYRIFAVYSLNWP